MYIPCLSAGVIIDIMLLIIGTVRKLSVAGTDTESMQRFFGYFHLSIVSTGCPSERRLTEDGYLVVVTGNSVRIQDGTTESSAWFFNLLGV